MSKKTEIGKPSSIRDREKREIMKKRGPLHVPVEIKQDGFIYPWVAVSDDNPYDLVDKLAIGYEHVTYEEAPAFKHLKSASASLTDAPIHADHVRRKSKCGAMMYLMKVPEEIWNEEQDLNNKLADSKEEALVTGSHVNDVKGNLELENANRYHIFDNTIKRG